MITAIERFQSVSLRLCLRWADTYNYSDKDIVELIRKASINMIEKAGDSIMVLRQVDEACEELEFLVELLTTNCRHNDYERKLL